MPEWIMKFFILDEQRISYLNEYGSCNDINASVRLIYKEIEKNKILLLKNHDSVIHKGII